MPTTFAPHTRSTADRARDALDTRPRLRPPVTRRDATSLAAFALATAGAAGLGFLGPVRKPRRLGAWYRRLRAPSRLHAPRVLAPVWRGLYPLVAISGWRVWRSTRGDPAARRRALALWAAQLGLNAAWPPLFFRRRKARAALADAVALMGTAGAFAATARRVDRPASWLFAPYLGWVGFAAWHNAGLARRHA